MSTTLRAPKRTHYSELTTDEVLMALVHGWVRDHFSQIPMALLGAKRGHWDHWEVTLRREWTVKAERVPTWGCEECGTISYGGTDPSAAPACCPVGCWEPGWEEGTDFIYLVWSEGEDSYSEGNNGWPQGSYLNQNAPDASGTEAPPLPEVDPETVSRITGKQCTEDVDVWSDRDEAQVVADRLSEKAEEETRSYGCFPFDAQEGFLDRYDQSIIPSLTPLFLDAGFTLASYAPGGQYGGDEPSFRFVSPDGGATYSRWLALYAALHEDEVVPTEKGVAKLTTDARTDLERLGDVLTEEACNA